MFTPTYDGGTAPAVTGQRAFTAALMFEGDDQASAVAEGLKFAKVNPRERITFYQLAVGANTLSRAMCNEDCLAAYGSGATSLFVPLTANIADIGAFVWDDTAATGLSFAIARFGVGAVGLTFEGYDPDATWGDADTAKVFWNRDPMNLLQGQEPNVAVMIGFNTWMVL
jgi:hypothetical protein